MSEGGIPGVEPGMISRRPVHRGPVVDLGIDTVRFPDGSTGELEMVRHSGAAAVLPVLSDPAGPDPQVVLVRQYRYAAGDGSTRCPRGARTTPARRGKSAPGGSCWKRPGSWPASCAASPPSSPPPASPTSASTCT